jgi:voltage-gated sodium channel
MIKACQKVANSDVFQSFILCLIILTAVSMGLETIPELVDAHYLIFDGLFYFTQTIFALEILIRLLAFAPNYKRFFDEFWNVFDFAIVILSFLPAIGAFIVIARLLRVLRVLRAISMSERLRAFMDRLTDTFDEVLYSSLLILILGYIFAISGHFLFYEVDPNNWGNLWRATLSVFYLGLLQDVSDFVDPVIASSAFYLFYFICFYLIQFGLILSVLNAALTQSIKEDK